MHGAIMRFKWAKQCPQRHAGLSVSFLHQPGKAGRSDIKPEWDAQGRLRGIQGAASHTGMGDATRMAVYLHATVQQQDGGEVCGREADADERASSTVIDFIPCQRQGGANPTEVPTPTYPTQHP